MRNEIEIKSLAELKKYVVEHSSKYSTSKRYELKSTHVSDPFDIEEAKAYNDLAWKNNREMSQEDFEAWYKETPRPEYISYNKYWLQERGDKWGAERMNLNPDLGEAIEGIWTKRIGTYSRRPEMVGGMSLAGILKRLGEDVTDDVKAKAHADELARIAREKAYNREQVAKAAAELLRRLELVDPEVYNMVSVEDLRKLSEIS